MRTGIFIGRFQPAHPGHIEAIAAAAKQVDILHILVGSANACRSIKNPWTFQERKENLTTLLHASKSFNITVSPLNDYPYSDSQWIADVRATTEYLRCFQPTIFGLDKEGNEYLKWFPDWNFVNVTSSYTGNATEIRKKMFLEKNTSLPKTIHDDFAYYEKEAKLFANYPFPETLNFNCADAVLECQGHILLIKRKHAPGAGAWALPGGFRDHKDKTFLDCAIRELMEEANVRIPEKVLRGSIIKTELFDYIKRSYGIPRNTLAVYFRVNPNPDGTMPRVSPHDDAIEAKWFTLTEVLNSVNLYDDHKGIISKLTGVMPLPAFVTTK